jgi:phosphate uptake regulator
MISFDGLDENFTFLILEVTNHINATFTFLEDPNPSTFDKIIDRDDYIDNLKNVIENKCFSTIHGDRTLSKPEIDRIRVIHLIAVNLERIADYCVNIVRQMKYLSEPHFLSQFDYGNSQELITGSIEAISTILQDKDLSGALDICRAENWLDQMYKTNFDRIMVQLRIGREVENNITSLFIFRYLERIGDSLLNVGEALLFAIIGEKIKINQFQALQQTLEGAGMHGSVADINFQGIWGSRSGCRIGRVDDKDDKAPQAQASIFKEGSRKKILQEKINIECWDTISPGLVPKIFSYHEEDDKASMLAEFLPGCTMDETILTSSMDVVENAFFVMTETVESLWSSTMTPSPIETDYMRQIRGRMSGVHQVHPAFSHPEKHVGSTRIASFLELLDRCQSLEAGCAAPFTIFIHGDFNSNNVVYNHVDERIYFIDVYRSRNSDYIQDVSVFLVSNFRAPIFDPLLRDRLNLIISRFLRFAESFAARQNDHTFAFRLALALARSFYTSTRFELDPLFAKEMYLRAIYLMEKVAAHKGKPEETFLLPEHILYY